MTRFLPKTVEAQKRKIQGMRKGRALWVNGQQAGTKERHRRSRVPLSLPSIAAPTLAEIEAKYGK